MKSIKCPVCHKIMDNDMKQLMSICFKCFSDITMRFSFYKEALENGIRGNYNIITVDQRPIMDCDCGNGTCLPFDFFTKEKKGKFAVVLNSICTKCGGYKEIETEDILDINFRPSNTCVRYHDKPKEAKERCDNLYG